MKKLISLLLVLVLLAGVASAAFTDAAKIDTGYLTAVEAMNEKKIITGFEDGSFKPKDTLTRAQAAKILCTMLVGDAVPEGKSEFADVPAGHWAEKFVAYCAEKQIVSGVGSGKFNPNGKLTCCAFAKMLLVAYGHDAEKEGLTGEKWIVGTQKAMREANMNLGVSAADTPMERQAACQMAYNFYMDNEIKKADPAKYKEQTISFKDSKNVKLYGRSDLYGGGVRLNFPGDAVEFTLDCKGTLTVPYTSEESAYYTCFVDGVEFSRRAQTANGSGKMTLYQLISPGSHKIRIVRDSEISTKGASTVLTGVNVACDAATMKATPQNKLYIEAFGASIEAGCGTLGGKKDTWSSSYHAGSKSYVYVAADLLNADYAIVAKGGIGFSEPSGGKVGADLYTCQHCYRSDEPYKFERKPDVIIYDMGGNDDNATEQISIDNKVNFAKVLREKNGPNVKIVFVYNTMKAVKEGTVGIAQKACEALGGEANGVYALRGILGNNGVPAKAGGTPHPGAADHAANGKLLADYLRTILNLQ